MATSVVHRITVFDNATFESTIVPALVLAAPALGNNYSAATLTALGGTCIGSRDRGDAGDIDSEAVGVKPMVDGVTVKPAGSLAAQRFITRSNGIQEVTWTAYDIAQGIFELDSSVVTEDGVSQRTATQTNRALIIERDGICAESYPNVVLHIVDESGGFGPGDDAVSKLAFSAKVLGTSETKSGQGKLYYAAAGT